MMLARLRRIAIGNDIDASPEIMNKGDRTRSGVTNCGVWYSEAISVAPRNTIELFNTARQSRIVQAVFKYRGSSPFGSRITNKFRPKSPIISMTKRIDIRIVIIPYASGRRILVRIKLLPTLMIPCAPNVKPVANKSPLKLMRLNMANSHDLDYGTCGSDL